MDESGKEKDSPFPPSSRQSTEQNKSLISQAAMSDERDATLAASTDQVSSRTLCSPSHCAFAIHDLQFNPPSMSTLVFSAHFSAETFTLTTAVV
jgi:hypothetical protein